MDVVAEKVRNFVLSNFLFTDDPGALQDEASLIDAGIVDSTGIIELIGYLEENFKIKVADDEMVPENLDSVARIAQFVAGKLGTY